MTEGEQRTCQSLYTNVPIIESINICTDLLFRDSVKTLPIDKETSIQLSKIASCNVVMSTRDVNAWWLLSTDRRFSNGKSTSSTSCERLDKQIWRVQGNAKLFTCYMDDILREIKRSETDQKLGEINNLHPNLSFTIDRETDSTLPFLDIQLIHKGHQLASMQYSKPTDTGLILNFHALAPEV